MHSLYSELKCCLIGGNMLCTALPVQLWHPFKFSVFATLYLYRAQHVIAFQCQFLFSLFGNKP